VNEPPEPPELRALAGFASTAAKPASEMQLARGLNSLRLRLSRERPTRKRVPRWSIIVLGLVIFVALGRAALSFR